MATRTKTERNAVNEVRNFIDGTSCLRSYLQENDKTPLWDGTVFVYRREPDKNETLVGTVKAQVKGTDVDAFLSFEQYRITSTELNLYMLEGGLFFFVVEMLKNNIRERKIFYKKLTPNNIKVLLKQHSGQKTIKIMLQPLPADEHLFEDEMLNFVTDARKQVSFVGQKELSFAEALGGAYPLVAEGTFNSSVQSSLPLLVTSQPFTLYQETPHASIPVSDIELIARATEYHHESVSVGGKVYFNEHSRIYDLKTITENVGNCLFFTYPKQGYECEPKTHVEIKYPRRGAINDVLHTIEFLMAIKKCRAITFGHKEYPLQFTDEDNDMLFRDIQYTYDLYCDIDALWRDMQIPGTFSFDEFDDAELQQFLNIVLHVYRKEPGIPAGDMKGEKSYYSMLSVGKLHILILFTHLRGEYYDSKDAFTVPVIINEGRRYPLLSLVLAKEPAILPDNIHNAEQMEVYKKCLNEDSKFMAVVEHDLAELRKRIPYVENKQKLGKVEALVEYLERLMRKTNTKK